MPKKAKNTALATTGAKSKALAITKAPAYIKSTARGTEKLKAADVTLPFLRLANEKSPAVIDGLVKVGQWYNSVTNESFGESVEVIVLCAIVGQMHFGEYGSDEGILCRAADGETADAPNGETVKGKPTNKCAECKFSLWTTDKKGKIVKPECMKQGIFFVTLPGTSAPMILVLQSTNFPAARRLNTILASGGVDAFAHVIGLSYVPVKGPKGTTFKVSVSKIGFVEEEDFKNAEKLYTSTSKLLTSSKQLETIAADEAE